MLWILPNDTAQTPEVRLGIDSMEFAPVAYRLVVTLDDQVVYEWASIGLQPGGKWESAVVLPNLGSTSGNVEATLYRLDNPEVVYRRVSLALGPVQVTSR
jgi:hypothetical protein